MKKFLIPEIALTVLMVMSLTIEPDAAVLAEKEAAGLVKMREEEKLALDVYSFLYDKWGIKTFANISKSELQHTQRVKTLLDNYSVDDPVKNDTRGVFTDNAMTKLYNDLTSAGSKSVAEAITVGLTVEDLDIKDLKELMAETRNADILSVYTNLLNGSYNHMRAFTNQANKYNVTYTPQYISEKEYREILKK